MPTPPITPIRRNNCQSALTEDTSAKAAPASATVMVSSPRGPCRSASVPTQKPASPPTSRFTDSAAEMAPRLQPNSSPRTGRNTP